MALVQFAVPDQPHAPYQNVQSTGTLSMELVRFAVPDLPQHTEPDPGRNVQPSLSMALFQFSVPDLKLSSWRFNLWLHFFTGLQYVVWELRDTVIRIRIYLWPVIYRIVSEKIYSIVPISELQGSENMILFSLLAMYSTVYIFYSRYKILRLNKTADRVPFRVDPLARIVTTSS